MEDPRGGAPYYALRTPNVSSVQPDLYYAASGEPTLRERQLEARVRKLEDLLAKQKVQKRSTVTGPSATGRSARERSVSAARAPSASRVAAPRVKCGHRQKCTTSFHHVVQKWEDEWRKEEERMLSLKRQVMASNGGKQNGPGRGVPPVEGWEGRQRALAERMEVLRDWRDAWKNDIDGKFSVLEEEVRKKTLGPMAAQPKQWQRQPAEPSPMAATATSHVDPSLHAPYATSGPTPHSQSGGARRVDESLDAMRNQRAALANSVGRDDTHHQHSHRDSARPLSAGGYDRRGAAGGGGGDEENAILEEMLQAERAYNDLSSKLITILQRKAAVEV